MELFERIQNAGLSRLISESTWGYPIVGALHVLAFALFGAMLIPSLRDETRRLRRIGLTLTVVTGLLLFVSGASRYYESTSFRIKMALLALLVVNSLVRSERRAQLHAAIALTLWAAVIFAARGIAFF